MSNTQGLHVLCTHDFVLVSVAIIATHYCQKRHFQAVYVRRSALVTGLSGTCFAMLSYDVRI